MVSDVIDKSSEMQKYKGGKYTTKSLKRFLVLSKADFSKWSDIISPAECIFLFETINNEFFDNSEMLRATLIRALSDAEIMKDRKKRSVESTTVVSVGHNRTEWIDNSFAWRTDIISTSSQLASR